MTDYKNELLKLISNNPKRYTIILKTDPNYKHILDWIIDSTPKLNGKSIATRIYWIINDLKDFPKCANETCNHKFDDRDVLSVTRGYPRFCSYKCSSSDKNTKEKIKKTNLERYGVENCSKSKEIIEKIKYTNLEKYGCICPVHNKDIERKMRENNLKKYGVDHYSKTKEYKNKIKETCQEKYGVDNPLSSPEIIQKCKDTMMKKYGVEYNTQSKELKDLSKKNLIEKYGENYTKVIWGGHGNPGQSRRSYKFILNSPNVEPLFTEDEFVECKKKDILYKFNFRCKKCGTVFNSYWDNGKSTMCPNCRLDAGGGISDEENELYEFVRSIVNDDVLKNNRTLISPLELDIVIQNKKLAIEFDGLYWHNDNIKTDIGYHLNKTVQCNKLGYRLIHIFEDEWNYKKDIIKSRLKDIINCTYKTKMSNNYNIIQLTWDDTYKFLNDNHILDCSKRTDINFGLYENNIIVAVMSFITIDSNKNEYELYRYCMKKDVLIDGCMDIMLNYFETTYKPNKIITYVDLRWSDKRTYENLGFKLMRYSEPEYWYFDLNELKCKSRFNYSKNNLKSILKCFDENKSEVENMKDNGYLRIFDCGNMVFIKEYNNGIIKT